MTMAIPSFSLGPHPDSLFYQHVRDQLVLPCVKEILSPASVHGSRRGSFANIEARLKLLSESMFAILHAPLELCTTIPGTNLPLWGMWHPVIVFILDELEGFTSAAIAETFRRVSSYRTIIAASNDYYLSASRTVNICVMFLNHNSDIHQLFGFLSQIPRPTQWHKARIRCR